MKIKLLPQRCNDTLTVLKQGEVLTINGSDYDFTNLPDGGKLPLYSNKEDLTKTIDCKWIVSDVKRINGELELTLLLPHGPNASEAARFPEPIMDPADGEVELPK